MLNLGGGEILVILLLALIVLGPERLPKAAREVGSWMRELRRLSAGFQEELRSAIDLDPDDEARHYRDGDKPFRPHQASLSARSQADRTPAGDQPAPGEDPSDPGAGLAGAGGGFEVVARNDSAPTGDRDEPDRNEPGPDDPGGGAAGAAPSDGALPVPPALDKPVSPGGPADLRVVPPPEERSVVSDARPGSAPGERATG